MYIQGLTLLSLCSHPLAYLLCKTILQQVDKEKDIGVTIEKILQCDTSVTTSIKQALCLPYLGVHSDTGTTSSSHPCTRP